MIIVSPSLNPACNIYLLTSTCKNFRFVISGQNGLHVNIVQCHWPRPLEGSDHTPKVQQQNYASVDENWPLCQCKVLVFHSLTLS